MARLPMSERIARNCLPEDERGCLNWTARTDRDGYGQMWVVIDGVKRLRMAHRVSYEEFVGPIPDRLVIDHLCRNRACVNPDHMEPVTNEVNSSRGNDRPYSCKRGHSRTSGSVYVTRAGRRVCRECLRESYSTDEYRERKRVYNTRQRSGLNEEIRQWARDQGMPVGNRGRIPKSVTVAYEADRR